MQRIVKINLDGKPGTIVDLALISTIGSEGSKDADIDVEISMMGASATNWALFKSEEKKEEFIQTWIEFRRSHDLLGRLL